MNHTFTFFNFYRDLDSNLYDKISNETDKTLRHKCFNEYHWFVNHYKISENIISGIKL